MPLAVTNYKNLEIGVNIAYSIHFYMAETWVPLFVWTSVWDSSCHLLAQSPVQHLVPFARLKNPLLPGRQPFHLLNPSFQVPAAGSQPSFSLSLGPPHPDLPLCNGSIHLLRSYFAEGGSGDSNVCKQRDSTNIFIIIIIIITIHHHHHHHHHHHPFAKCLLT